MKELLFAAMLLWVWDPDPVAERYYLYWSNNMAAPWQQCNRAEVTEPRAEDVVPDPFPGEVFYVIVTGHNAAGEGPTDHGWIMECQRSGAHRRIGSEPSDPPATEFEQEEN